jgi:hypothetical protein
MNRSRAAVAVVSLLLLSVGSAWVFLPAGLIVPGALLWLDLTLGSVREK